MLALLSIILLNNETQRKASSIPIKQIHSRAGAPITVMPQNRVRRKQTLGAAAGAARPLHPRQLRFTHDLHFSAGGETNGDLRSPNCGKRDGTLPCRAVTAHPSSDKSDSRKFQLWTDLNLGAAPYQLYGLPRFTSLYLTVLHWKMTVTSQWTRGDNLTQSPLTGVQPMGWP